MFDPVEFRLALLHALRPRRPAGFSYAAIGRHIPGVARKPPRGYVWRATGEIDWQLHHKIVVRGASRTVVGYPVASPIMTLVPTEAKAAKLNSWRRK